ncbi:MULTISPECIES: hypothetical protein [Paenibacillus]|uniref:hypothetical protein n=1 Tax=Paenibacillus TaxID=44249 RepID=UPI00038F76C1|nr:MULTISPECIES: hypothetical protein [Paenibacillus]CDN44743.1 Uncharacterized protein BN871_FM_00030 [Paenibacillus sp. P22]
MSQPNIPDITPEISVTKKEALSLLLSSIAMEELALSNLINAEADNILALASLIKKEGCLPSRSLQQIQQNTAQFIEGIVIKQWLALNRLDRIIHLAGHEGTCECCHSEVEE